MCDPYTSLLEKLLEKESIYLCLKISSLGTSDPQTGGESRSIDRLTHGWFSTAGQPGTDQHQNQHQDTTYAGLEQDQHMLYLGAGFAAGLCCFLQQVVLFYVIH